MGFRSWRIRLTFGSRWWRWGLGAVAALAVLVVLASFLVQEPLRRYIEGQMNARLDGYTASIRSLDFHLLGGSWDLNDVVLSQDAHPDPPVLRIKELRASVQWRSLVFGRVVSNFELVEPTIYIDREHLVREAEDDVPVDERGWQDALQAAYPFKINEFEIVRGDVTYVEPGQATPLRVSDINAVARNIRNVRSDPETYPSPLHVDAMVFESGRLVIDGHADFLAAPHAGVKGRIDLAEVALDYFKPVLARYNLELTRGTLTGRGLIEYAPTVKIVDLDEVRLHGLEAAYVYRKRSAGKAKAVASKTAEAAKEVSNKPDTLIKVRELTARDSIFAFVNADASPRYRVFIANTDITLMNFSNHNAEGTATASLQGRFMGSGPTLVKATFRPETRGADFDLDLKVESTDMRRMNDLLRAHGKIDVVSGVFSLFTEMRVKNGRVDGYVKPLFRDLDVFDKAQDADKGVVSKLKEKAADVAAKIFKNPQREEVATRADISGPLENPNASTWQIVVNILRNAFVKAIMPGFEREASRGRG